MELVFENYLISDDKQKLDIAYIHHYLSKESYWAQNIPLDVVKRSIEGSMAFGIYCNGQQCCFARVITDQATFAYLADVFVDEAHRKKGLSKELIRFILNHPLLQGLRRFMLATKDAHGLYALFGFNPLKEPGRFMEMKSFEHY